MLPATKAQPKETLPLVDKPIIQYAVEEAAASGLRQVVIVTSMGKRAVEDHFDRSPEIERALEAKGDTERLEDIRKINELADIVYVRQHEQLGIGHAVLQVRHVIGREPFALFFPDDVIVSTRPATLQLIDMFSAHGGSVLAVEEVSEDEVHNYGIVDGEPVEEGLWRVRGLVEKPTAAEAPSRLGVVGRYVLTPEIFDALDATAPGKNGEIQITDGLAKLLNKQPMYAKRFEGNRYDTGRPLGLLKASIEIGLSRPELRDDLANYVRSLDLS
jgi:UTP--glucose-1-phosphate uridylyltransferase